MNRVSAAFITSPSDLLDVAERFLPEAERLFVTLEALRAEVRGHDDDRVRKINLLAAAVRHPAFVECLKEDVHQIRRRLFDLIEQQDRVRIVAKLLGQNAAAFRSDDAARHADQLFDADRPVAIFAHVDADHLALVAEHKFGNRLGKLGLPDARRPEEKQHAVRSVMIVLQRPFVQPKPFGDRTNRVLLSDHAMRRDPTSIAENRSDVSR